MTDIDSHGDLFAMPPCKNHRRFTRNPQSLVPKRRRVGRPGGTWTLRGVMYFNGLRVFLARWNGPILEREFLVASRSSLPDCILDQLSAASSAESL